MNHLFIINPAAGKGKALKLIPEIEKIFKNREDKFIIEITTETGHATEIAKQYSSGGDYRIYSVGGDGTLNEVLNGMVHCNCSLAVIPAGSGNDFVKSIYNCTEDNSIEDKLLSMINGKEKEVDLGIVNGRYFLNIASAGFDADVTYNSIKLKKLPIINGKLGYILGILITLFKFKTYNLKIDIDNKKFELNTLLIAVANGKYYGGGINVAPRAIVDDGLFNICLIERVGRFKILRLFPKVIKGKHERIKEVSFHNGKRINLRCEEEMSLNIDGEIIRDKRVEFSIIKNGIKVVVP